MIRLPRDMSHDDVTQWLQGGVYLVRTKPQGQSATWTPCRWVGMAGGRVVSIGIADGVERRTSHTSCAAVWPELGCFNSPLGFAVHLARTVERQYRRTWHSRLTQVLVPWAYKVGIALSLDHTTLTHWTTVCGLPFNPVYPASIDEAMEWLEGGKPTVAVNRRLIVAGDGRTDKRLFYLDGVLVANVVGGMLSPMCKDYQLAALNRMLEGRFNAI